MKISSEPKFAGAVQEEIACVESTFLSNETCRGLLRLTIELVIVLGIGQQEPETQSLQKPFPVRLDEIP